MGNSVAEFKEGMSNYRDRDRIRITHSGPSEAWFATYPSNPAIYAAGFSERTVDNNHPAYYKLLRRRREDGGRHPWLRNLDIGHPFAKESVEISVPSIIDVKQLVSGSTFRGHKGYYAPTVAYRTAMKDIAAGRFLPIPTNLGFDRFSLWTYGSTAIKKSLPDIPEFSLFRFVGELRAGLPEIPLKTLAKERKLRNTGGEYLNVQFGIMPLVSDLQKFFDALQHPAFRSAVKHQLGKEMRVRKVLEENVTRTTRSLTATEMNTTSVSVGRIGSMTTESSYKVWSSCSFAYHQVSMLDQLLADLDDTLGGMGAVPTSIDIWNLMPWSWLIDWFTNFSDVITNLSYLGRDGLYLQRGYVMAHCKDVEITQQKCTAYGVPISTTGVRTFERKYRVRASPFGFGYTWKDFDAFQLSILGALGVNRLKV